MSSTVGDRSPTIRRRLLAERLHQYRGRISRDVAAGAIGLTGTAITRFENARTVPTERQLIGLLDLYGVEEPDRSLTIQLAHDASKFDWWQSYREAVPEQFEMFFGLETEARKLTSYELAVIPGLLQTPDYYRAYLETPPVATADVEALIKFRMERKARRLRKGRIDIIIDEAVLHRTVGSREIMEAQFEHIIELGESHRNLSIRILPFDAGAHHGMNGSFMLMTFDPHIAGPVLYTESCVDGRFIEDPEAIRRYTLIIDHLRQLALSKEDSLTLLGRGVPT